VSSIGIFVGERGNWSFFRDIFADLRANYDTVLFQPKVYQTPLLYGRLNRWSLRHRVRSVMRRCDVAFFEWASELLEVATHQPKCCPVVTRLHAFELYAWGPRINWDRVDRVILVSEAMRRNFIEEYPAHADKTVVVYNGVRLDTFKPDPQDGSLNLGMLCSMIPRKRVYEAILAFHELRGRGIPATLHVAGGRVPGPGQDEYYIACHRLVKKLHLEDDVRFYERIEGTAEWLRQIDVFISHSFWEGHQVALVEAMASGCYCLSHGWGGVEEVLPAACVYVSDGELLDKISEYHSSPAAKKRELRATMRQLACSRFDAEVQKRRIRQVIDGLLPDGLADWSRGSERAAERV
jgi:glycosyltransferase involved in cell wall biosynthesis